jgi:hypothetical protein
MFGQIAAETAGGQLTRSFQKSDSTTGERFTFLYIRYGIILLLSTSPSAFSRDLRLQEERRPAL